ncbi:MAG: hypothetical protein HY670_00785 [Chloroflexi bacterium]|nr:hypothetical protein [Chloroflexota bacterium]
MRRLFILSIVVAIAGLLAFAACVPSRAPGYQQPYPYGSGGGGMMGGGGMGGGMMGPGGMGGGMMGPGGMGGGMMGGGAPYNPQARPITIDQAAEAVRLYLNTYGGDLAVTEIMEFAFNFYAEVEETATGVHAMELLIDRYSGQVYPEMGPNMMWNTKYGMMGSQAGTPSARMPVGPEQAQNIAQKYLDTSLPGLTVAEADTFYGYYTLHTMKGGQIEGMLSVNGYSGAVWYHTWHGPFIGMKEFE